MMLGLGIFIVGTAAVLLTRRRPAARRVCRWIGLGLSVVLSMLWVVSVRYAFGYVGSSACVYFESGAYSMFATRGQWPAEGWLGIGRSRWPVIWRPEAPALLLMMPLWMPLSGAVIPTVFLCRRTLRSPPGHCQTCGYNLTGDVSGVCPECGTPIAASSVPGDLKRRSQPDQ